ncbi:ribosome biogenesis protein SLX9 homolog [Petromyzon marinus]|uniref:ribosome biogenesis protein SLX9 homolog n=1 Tax=Petromyzon marinus TaxID=7757 RepID=UPI003F6F52DE
MGKVKRARQKFHRAAGKDGGGGGGDEDPSLTPVSVLAKISSLFSVTDADDGSKQQNPKDDGRKQQSPKDDDSKSVVSSRTGEKLQISKKDKRKMRHDRFLEKIEAIKIARQKQLERIKRSKTAVVGDMHTLANALPELGQLSATVAENPSKCTSDSLQRSNPSKITKSKRKKMLEDELSRHAQVLSHPAFKADPLAAISEHLRNKMKQEDLEHMQHS